jgi:PEP-CTERM motif
VITNLGDFAMTLRAIGAATGMLAFLMGSSAYAGIVTFSGQDDGASTSGPWPMSAAADASFLAAAAGFGTVRTETFEELPVGTGALGASFAIEGATVSSNTNLGPNDGFGGVNDTTIGNLYGFNITAGGSHWFGFPNTAGPSVATFAFSKPTNSFGFYTTGVQTVFTATLTVGFNDGASETLDLPINIDGGASFFGFTDTSPFKSVTITDVATASGTDAWGIDNVSYNFGVIPEPSTWALMGLGFAGLALVGLRQSRRGDLAAA